MLCEENYRLLLTGRVQELAAAQFDEFCAGHSQFCQVDRSAVYLCSKQLDTSAAAALNTPGSSAVVTVISDPIGALQHIA